MNITEITKRAGAHKKRRRVGRGEGSGWGKTSGRGHKGAGQRAGSRRMSLMEGGMFPLFRRIPKHGFNNAIFRTEYQVVNVGDLEARFEARSNVTASTLEEAGLIADHEKLVKILGNGEIKKPLNVEAQRFSSSAVAKIEAAGGTVKKLGEQPKKKFVKRPKPVVKKADRAEKSEDAKAAKSAKPQKKSGPKERPGEQKE